LILDWLCIVLQIFFSFGREFDHSFLDKNSPFGVVGESSLGS